jgi:hypothetical protein
MYVLLLCVGAATAVAGIALTAMGVPIIGRPYDPTVITPGAFAIVGGLLLLGLGLTVRALGRIERVLAIRPVLHTAAADIVPQSAVVVEHVAPPAVAMPPPLPVTFGAEPDTQAAAIAAPSVTAEDAAAQQQRLQEKFPALVRLDSAVAAVEANASPLAKPPYRVESTPDFANGVATVPARGPAPPRAMPRRDPPVRTAARTDRTRNLDAVWPKRPPPIRAAPPAELRPIEAPEAVLPAEPMLPIEQASPPALVQFGEVAAQPRNNGAAAEAPRPVSILKSGIVDGMAYTLYADGSIEAQLPQGTLRFGSITELRNHVEQNS